LKSLQGLEDEAPLSAAILGLAEAAPRRWDRLPIWPLPSAVAAETSVGSITGLEVSNVHPGFRMNTNLVRTPTAATAAAARSATAATATAPVPAETAPATAARRATSTRTASTSKRSASTALTRLGFINCKGRTSHILAVQSRYCGLGLVLIRHLDEAETPGPPGKIVLDDLCRIDITKAFESFTQFFLGGLCRQIPNVNVHVFFFSFRKG
jgi:hypothetical protein